MYVITSIGIIIQKYPESIPPAPRFNSELQIVIEASSLWRLASFTDILQSDGILSYNSAQHGGINDKVIFYGPYTMLPSGTYRVDIGNEIVGKFVLRLTGEYGQLVLHEQVISSPDDLVSFTTITPVAQFEVVMCRTDTSERLTVDRIVLIRT
jgi:hypothetical protein